MAFQKVNDGRLKWSATTNDFVDGGNVAWGVVGGDVLLFDFNNVEEGWVSYEPSYDEKFFKSYGLTAEIIEQSKPIGVKTNDMVRVPVRNKTVGVRMLECYKGRNGLFIALDALHDQFLNAQEAKKGMLPTVKIDSVQVLNKDGTPATTKQGNVYFNPTLTVVGWVAPKANVANETKMSSPKNVSELTTPTKDTTLHVDTARAAKNQEILDRIKARVANNEEDVA